MAAKTEKARGDAGFEDHMRAGIRHVNAWDRTALAEVWGVGSTARRLIDQAALLPGAAPVKIFEVMWAFCTGGGNHRWVRRGSDARHVGAVAGVDTDHIALFHEERNLHLQPGFGGDGLCRTGSRVALYGHLGLGDSKIDGCGELDI